MTRDTMTDLIRDRDIRVGSRWRSRASGRYVIVHHVYLGWRDGREMVCYEPVLGQTRQSGAKSWFLDCYDPAQDSQPEWAPQETQ